LDACRKISLPVLPSKTKAARGEISNQCDTVNKTRMIIVRKVYFFQFVYIIWTSHTRFVFISQIGGKWRRALQPAIMYCVAAILKNYSCLQCTMLKSKLTICTSSYGLFLPCRGKIVLVSPMYIHILALQ
jgi:hypothetical protein